MYLYPSFLKLLNVVKHSIESELSYFAHGSFLILGVAVFTTRVSIDSKV